MLFAPRANVQTAGFNTEVSDGQTTDPRVFSANKFGGTNTCLSWFECNNVALRHTGTANVLYCDGHVKASNFGTMDQMIAGGLQSFVASSG
jgi:prepilin-type processing-associated H-X9-DG protein